MIHGANPDPWFMQFGKAALLLCRLNWAIIEIKEICRLTTDNDQGKSYEVRIWLE